MERNPDNSYLDTIARLEPDIAMIDPGAYYASAAISLKRLADAADHQAISLKRLADLLEASTPTGFLSDLGNTIYQALRGQH